MLLFLFCLGTGSRALTPYLDLLGVGKLRPLHERKKSLKFVQDNSKWHHSTDRIGLRDSYSSSIVIMAVSCTVFEINRDIGRKRQIFIPPSI